jgi:hypothetical protein
MVHLQAVSSTKIISLPLGSALLKAVGRTKRNFLASSICTVDIALPAYMGCKRKESEKKSKDIILKIQNDIYIKTPPFGM